MKRNTENTVCLLCGSRSNVETIFPTTYFNNKYFIYLKCRKCKLIFINPLLSEEDYSILYQIDYHNESFAKEDIDFSWYYKKIKPFINKGDKLILDYGCGNSFLINYLKKKGFTVMGTRYNNEIVA